MEIPAVEQGDTRRDPLNRMSAITESRDGNQVFCTPYNPQLYFLVLQLVT